jgi:hypothetical protein
VTTLFTRGANKDDWLPSPDEQGAQAQNFTYRFFDPRKDDVEPCPASPAQEFVTFDEGTKKAGKSVVDKPVSDLCRQQLAGATDSVLDAGASVAPPDGGWAWLVVLFGAVAHITIDGIIVSYGILMMDLMKDDFGKYGVPMVSGIGSTMVGISLMIGPLSAALINRYGLRNCAVGGILVGSTGLFISSFIYNIVLMFFFYGIVSG